MRGWESIKRKHSIRQVTTGTSERGAARTGQGGCQGWCEMNPTPTTSLRWVSVHSFEAWGGATWQPCG